MTVSSEKAAKPVLGFLLLSFAVLLVSCRRDDPLPSGPDMTVHASYLSTHVLDTACGVPAEGVAVELHRLESDGAATLLRRTVTDRDGRARDPLVPEEGVVPGRYELRFHVGAYFARLGLAADPPYLDVVPVRVFLAAGQGHYHVPLLCSPWSYTTYRGS